MFYYSKNVIKELFKNVIVGSKIFLCWLLNLISIKMCMMYMEKGNYTLTYH